MMEKFLAALPALIATVAGVGLYALVDAGNWPFAAVFAAVPLAIGVGSLLFAKAKMESEPEAAVLALALWVLGVIAISAIIVAVLLWLGLSVAGWLTDAKKPSDEVKELADLLVGAVTAALATMFTDDFDDAESGIWPAGRTKAAFKDAFEGKVTSGSRAYDAVFEGQVQASTEAAKDGIRGWGFTARRARAKVIKASLAAPAGVATPRSGG